MSKWIVSKQGILLKTYLSRMISHDKKRWISSIIYEDAHKYSSEKNAIRSAVTCGGVVEKIL